MMPDFSSAGSGTLVTPPVCQTEQGKGNFQGALYHAYASDAIAGYQGGVSPTLVIPTYAQPT